VPCHASLPLACVQLPLSANEWVTLNGAFPLTETAWQQLLRVLDVMKPGLVQTAIERLPESGDPE
jgi:hypothetical protein